jgi:O-methyltransferase
MITSKSYYVFIESVNKIFGKLNEFISNTGFVFTNRIYSQTTPNRIKVFERFDYVRIKTLDLIANEILSKNVAELGVFRGDFAAKINEAFPEKKIYLFDTFESFNETDENHDKLNKYHTTHHYDFSMTNVNLVLKKMPFAENCIVKKGYFPDTAQNIEVAFCFVSIDTDLYAPIYAGLCYFYPKMVEGGYIMIHDFNNSKYLGAREAVLKYCKENNVKYFPLCDGGGSCVILK